MVDRLIGDLHTHAQFVAEQREAMEARQDRYEESPTQATAARLMHARIEMADLLRQMRDIERELRIERDGAAKP